MIRTPLLFVDNLAMYPPTISIGRPISWSCCYQEPALIAFGLTTIVLLAEYAWVPDVSNVKPFLCCAFIVTLLIRNLSAHRTRAQSTTVSLMTKWRVAVFIVCHLLLISAALPIRKIGVYSQNVVPMSLAVARYVVLLPTVLLLPSRAWLGFARRYRAEWLATLILVLTFRPGRVFALAWPWYSSVLAHSIYIVARPFVADLQYVAASFPTLSGPSLDTTITFACGGLLIVELFQLLFGLLLILDWNDLNRRRTLMGYFLGIALLLLANVLRISLLVIAGNSISPDLVVSHHLSTSWLLVALALIGYMLVVYPWMLNKQPIDNQSSPNST